MISSARWNTTLTSLPQQDWGKVLQAQVETDLRHPKTGQPIDLRVFSVEPQARLIGVTMPVGRLAGYSPDAILVKAFEKNYRTPSKPRVVEGYGFEQQHAEPIEMLSYVYETIFDRACEAEANRYRHNSKNYESGRYVDYLKHGLTIVFPDDCQTEHQRAEFVSDVVLKDFYQYAKVVTAGGKRQEARRRLGMYVAIEGQVSINLRSLWHMARQRSGELSPNGREAEPQISAVVTEMVRAVEPYLPVFYPSLLRQIGKGYR